MSRILRASIALVILPVFLISLAGAASSNDELLKVRETIGRHGLPATQKLLRNWCRLKPLS
jgi:hypothetical protein